MSVATNIARILLGLVFALAGVAGFVGSPPQQPGIAGVVSSALYGSHWMWFVALAQLAIGISFLTNRFVPVGLIVLAAFLYNSFAFHILTSPMLLPLPIIVAVLGFIVARPYRALFAPIFKARASTQEPSSGSPFNKPHSAHAG